MFKDKKFNCFKEYINTKFSDTDSDKDKEAFFNILERNPALHEVMIWQQRTRWPDSDSDGIFKDELDFFLDNKKCPKYNTLKKCVLAVIYADLVSFKAYNTRLSEQVGHALIAFFAKYLSHLEILLNNNGFPKSQFIYSHWVVTRKGGDEFNAYCIRENPVCKNNTTLIIRDDVNPFKKDRLSESMVAIINNLYKTRIDIVIYINPPTKS